MPWIGFSQHGKLLKNQTWCGEADKKRNERQKTNTAEMETHPQGYVPGICQAGLISFHQKKNEKKRKHTKDSEGKPLG